MKILHLHVKFKYYKEVQEGIKTEEYREYKPYWDNMLVPEKDYDLIYYYKGYTKEKMVFKFTCCTLKVVKHEQFGNVPTWVYAIELKEQMQITEVKEE